MTTRSRLAWDPNERVEYDALLAAVVAETSNTSTRLDRMERLVADAIQAHRPWARDIERTCARQGYAAELKRYQDRNRALVAYDGQVLNLPKVQSRATRGEDGAVYHQRELIELWPWGDVRSKRIEALTGRRTYDVHVAYYDRLLALQDLCPESTSALDAAERLGIELDEYLTKDGIA